MAIQEKLATGQGKFTPRYPELGTGPVSYDDAVSEEFFLAEREAVFKRSWLKVGRVDQLPRIGSFFTRELVGLGSIVIVKQADGTVKALHNVCAHRGNKVVWQEHPAEETKGSCKAFTCKYHGWRYGLDGKVDHVTNEEQFFDLDKAPSACRSCTATRGPASSSSISIPTLSRCVRSSVRSSPRSRATRSRR